MEIFQVVGDGGLLVTKFYDTKSQVFARYSPKYMEIQCLRRQFETKVISLYKIEVVKISSFLHL